MSAPDSLFSALHRATALAVLSKESDKWTPDEWSRAAIDLASAVVACAGDIDKIDALTTSERAELDRLRSERRLGPQPHLCLNPDCSVNTYGSGYEACPTCGGTEGHA